MKLLSSMNLLAAFAFQIKSFVIMLMDHPRRLLAGNREANEESNKVQLDPLHCRTSPRRTLLLLSESDWYPHWNTAYIKLLSFQKCSYSFQMLLPSNLSKRTFLRYSKLPAFTQLISMSYGAQIVYESSIVQYSSVIAFSSKYSKWISSRKWDLLVIIAVCFVSKSAHF